MKNGWTWSRNAGQAAFLTNAGAKNIISTRVTSIIRYEDYGIRPAISRNRHHPRFLQSRKSYRYLLMNLPSSRYRRKCPVSLHLMRPPSESPCMAFGSRSPMLQPVKQSFILCPRCRDCVRRPVRRIKDISDHRANRHAQEFRWTHGDHPWHIPARPLRKCSLSFLWKRQQETEGSSLW